MRIQTTQAILRPRVIREVIACPCCGHQASSEHERWCHIVINQTHAMQSEEKSLQGVPQPLILKSITAQRLFSKYEHQEAIEGLQNDYNKYMAEELAEYKLNLMLKQSGRL